MRTIRTITELRGALDPPRRAGRRIGLVPTMGAFHQGHLSLMRQARSECDVVVVSLFVNPAQFNEGADLENYPRDEQRDADLAAAEGVDFLFAPPISEVYPDGFTTTVAVSGPSETLEGAERGRGHFDGVSTVVTKLFNMVGPDVAFFGQKDAQQALVIQKLVRDLNFGVEIQVCPTAREQDGLALSSRNVHLDAEQRARATALNRALERAAELTAGGATDTAEITAAARQVLEEAGVHTEYFALTDPDTLTARNGRLTGPTLALVAARVGDTRLIDNRVLLPNPAKEAPHA
ncbi:MAG: pantoate--beta-alanine ligase [Solirubrobacterales bacterium]|nr:pantoate--beta-alanine ligase [Solirubrobacterales bacterium]